MQSLKAPPEVCALVDQVARLVGIPIAFEWDQEESRLRLAATIEATTEMVGWKLADLESAAQALATRMVEDLCVKLWEFEALHKKIG